MAGLMIVEAPMGEGKTEAALAAAETLARRFGQDGLFVGMPTQATSDPMFARVIDWSAQLDGRVPVALSHGRARFNPLWRALRYGDQLDLYDDDEHASGQAIRWFLGRDRPLLTPICVGTVDNLLHAATRTRRVSLRFAGLGGKVVMLDEVHSYSVYMQQFLAEALRWLASAGCPVVLLTATLPPALKASLQEAYLEGASGRPQPVEPSEDPAYPLVTWACADHGGPAQCGAVAAPSGLPHRRITVQVLEDGPGRSPGHSGAQADLGSVVGPVVSDGGRVLVVCNTVDRAQTAYKSLRARFGDVVDLLHARFTAGDRAERADRLLAQLGPESSAQTGAHVIVGTQVLEQSLDIDADLVVTDLAPMDLLLQRIGRAHRHAARDPHRPRSASNPRVIITGVRFDEAGPQVPYGVDLVYSLPLLIRSAAMVLHGTRDGWELPTGIPRLVAEAYGENEDLLPAGWLPGYREANERAGADRLLREQRAASFLLGEKGSMASLTLAGLHAHHSGTLDTEDEVSAVVRDGPETVEVLLVRQRGADLYTLSGRRLTRGRVPVDDDDRAIEEACASVLRLPPRDGLTKAAKETRPAAAFESDPDLSGHRVLELGADGRAELGGYTIAYDPKLGLLTKRGGGTPQSQGR
jgi:CRISPR-associated endonuclease/helicase Cas3